MPHDYTKCPLCGARVDLPDNEPDALFKVTECLECRQTFDYDVKDIHQKPNQGDTNATDTERKRFEEGRLTGLRVRRRLLRYRDGTRRRPG